MTAKINMKSWYTMRMLKTFFRDVTTQSKTACRWERGEANITCQTSVRKTPNMKVMDWVFPCFHRTLSLGSLLMVLRGRRTLKTRRDFIVLMSRPLVFLLTLKHFTKKHRCICKLMRKDMWHNEKNTVNKSAYGNTQWIRDLQLDTDCLEPGRH